MGHQGGKFDDKKKRLEIYKYIETLEFELLGLPKPDAVILLYMPVDVATKIRLDRTEALDQHESNVTHLKKAAKTYLEIADLYDFHVIDCANGDEPKSIEEIHTEVVATYEKIIV